VNSLYLSTIETLAMAVDAKDQVTHGHIRRVQLYATELAKALGIQDQGLLKAIEASALLHDMGKLAIPEHILNKPGKLSSAEFEKMKMHAAIGADILSAIEFPYPVVPIVRHHHENWDGTGYPDGLMGTDIPIGARILAVVDCYDALTSDRPYRPKLSDADAVAILLERRGTMYDPLVVDTFIRVHAQLSADDVRDASVPHPAFADLNRGSFRRVTEPAEQRSPSTGGDSRVSAAERFAPRRLAALERVSTDIGENVGAVGIVFAIYDPAADQLLVQLVAGQGVESLLGQRILLGQRSLGWVAANRRSILNSDPALDLASGVLSRTPNLTSSLVVPVCDGDELVGVLALYSSRPFSKVEHAHVEAALPRLVDALRPAKRLRQAAAS
jgi:putative nucleotidyltransferase with HDIG domain